MNSDTKYAGHMHLKEGSLYIGHSELEALNALSAAIVTVSALHVKDLDKQGFPTILHFLRVAEAVKSRGQVCMIKALFHDTVEDSHVTIEDLRTGWGDNIAETVDHLTRRKATGETYMEYILRLRDAGDEDAIAIKLADLGDNMARDGAFPSLMERYQAAYSILLGQSRRGSYDGGIHDVTNQIPD